LDEITKTITDYIDQCEGKDWMEIAQKLSRVFALESDKPRLLWGQFKLSGFLP